jgi:F-type H+-transporting ATPase subunit epsilon
VSNDVVTILSDLAELGSQIDVERARKAGEQAERRLQQDHDASAEGNARRAHVRLAAAGGFAAG